jgi:drug/metabolite transporter (DMT)-like permease
MPLAIPQKTLILIAFACIYVFWGSTYLAIHIAGEHLAPPLVAGMRSSLSTLIICAICIARGVSLRVTRAEAWRLALVGILFMTVNNVLLTWAETMVPTGFASLIIAMVPILVALIETALPDGERLNLLGWLGTLLGAGGMFALVWPSLRRHTGEARVSQTLLGVGLLFLAALAFAVASVLSRRFRFTADTFVATAWQIGCAGIVNLTIAASIGSFHTAQWTRSGGLAIVYLSIFGSIVGLTAFTYLLQHVPVTKVSTYAFVNPIIAVLLGVFTLHERLAPTELAGMAIIVAAVALVILSRTKPAPASPNQQPATSN